MDLNSEQPHYLVSCVMVTKFEKAKLSLIKASLKSFNSQDYLHRELVIVFNGDRGAALLDLQKSVQALKISNVKICTSKEHLSIGSLRNLGIRNSSGDYICMWDDDDVFANNRLSIQIRCLIASKSTASILTKYCHYFSEQKKLLLSQWSNKSPCLGHPSSILFSKSIDIAYPDLTIKEDFEFVAELNRRYKVEALDTDHSIFVYVSHNLNTSGFIHHFNLAKNFSVQLNSTTKSDQKSALFLIKSLSAAKVKLLEPAQAITLLDRSTTEKLLDIGFLRSPDTYSRKVNGNKFVVRNFNSNQSYLLQGASAWLWEHHHPGCSLNSYKIEIQWNPAELTLSFIQLIYSELLVPFQNPSIR